MVTDLGIQIINGGITVARRLTAVRRLPELDDTVKVVARPPSVTPSLTGALGGRRVDGTVIQKSAPPQFEMGWL